MAAVVVLRNTSFYTEPPNRLTEEHWGVSRIVGDGRFVPICISLSSAISSPLPADKSRFWAVIVRWNLQGYLAETPPS